jgi:ribose transport system permease protein
MIATTQFGGITVPVIVLFVVAALTWYLLERTPVGRRLYAAGYNPAAARLAGVNVEGLRIATLTAGGAIAALAGALLTSRINAGDPTVGPSFLLPALTAVFLGSTQFRGGRFNVWGTIVAMYVLAVGIKGLQLAGSPRWVNDLFYGLALLLAVALSQWERGARRGGAIRGVLKSLTRRRGATD